MSKRQKKSISEENLSKLGKKLKQLRIKAGYSSYENFAHDFDLDRKQYWRMENGANITIKTLIKILQLHDKSLKDFFKKDF
jgi:transcriptional regulator with XRE-family HTH domain